MLETIKGDADLRQVPVVMLTGSYAEKNLIDSYGHGVNGFVVKPAGHNDFFDAIRHLAAFWGVLNSAPIRKD